MSWESDQFDDHDSDLAKMNMQYNKIKMYIWWWILVTFFFFFYYHQRVIYKFHHYLKKIIIRITFGNKNNISSLLVVLKVKRQNLKKLLEMIMMAIYNDDND